ncbi:uncharacterized protein LOC124813255 [Hydra vulgaris]|uniref:uncharacterized protein LOC124813255 n=1 Tax=Hydra vulgaris TaxID=6087 RepID=UPI001F5E60D2|nr:uncharacterized protein LOC124813255 [Hydra vulgaris]
MERQKYDIMDQKQSLTFLNMTTNNILNSLEAVNNQLKALTKRMNNVDLEMKKLDVLTKRMDNADLEMKNFLNKDTLERDLKLYEHILNYNKDNNKKSMSDNLIIELDQMDLRLQSNEPYHTQPSYSLDGYLYRLKILGYCNKEDKMGIYFQLMQSPMDHSLKWPFVKTVTCTIKTDDCYTENTKVIANYSEPLKECFEKPAQAYNRAVGTESFATHEQLKKHYIKNNKLIIHVSFIQFVMYFNVFLI